MEFKEIHQLTEAHYQLLLEADPNRAAVTDYLQRSRVFIAEEAAVCCGIIVLLPTRPATLEIVNVAVAPAYRGQKIATRLLHLALDFAKRAGWRTLEIGTGSSSFEQLYLYQKCGFRMTSIDRDFFVRHYPEEIIENKLVLKDMVRLSQDL